MSVLPSRDTIQAMRDPAPNWRWVVRLPTLSSNSGADGSSLGFSPGNNINNLNSFTSNSTSNSPVVPFGMVDQIDFQLPTIDSDERFAAGGKEKFARFISNPTVSISFFEDSNYSTTNYMATWRYLIVDEARNYSPASRFKFPIFLFAFNIISNTDPVFVGHMKGCWPSNLGSYSYSNSGSDKLTLTVEFAVDDAVPAASAGTQGSNSGNSNIFANNTDLFSTFGAFASLFG